MTPFAPRFDVLPRAQMALWHSLGPVARAGFVLYGGTAVALHLGHRQSVDFDFFASEVFEPAALRTELELLRGSLLIHAAPNTLTVSLVPEGGDSPVKLSFFGGLKTGRVGDPLPSDDGLVLVASLDDLLATKLKVLQDRVEARDYLDIAAMIRHGMSLAEGLSAAKTLYGPVFEPMIALRTVTWFADGDLSALGSADRQLLKVAASAVKVPLPTVPVRSRALRVE